MTPPATRPADEAGRFLSELDPWLRLTLIKGVGSAISLRLLSVFGNPENVLGASQATLAQHVTSRIAAAIKAGPDRELVDRTVEWLAQPGNRIITLADEEYPKRLLEIPDPPALLYVKGDCRLLQAAGLAIVGSRNATPQGLQNAEAFARDLSGRGWTVVSGLALGIDASAHLGALDGAGGTVAVVGTGLDIVYPARNHALAHRIAAKGAIISEYPLGTQALAGNFPRRNRLISGLARGVIVVEAALQSGSLITAREAAEQGREVFAIPGSIHSALSKGCHQLIKQGAKLVESANDILEELGAPVPLQAKQPTSAAEAAPTDGATADLLAALGHDPVDVDSLIARSGLTPDRAYAILLTLELDGLVGKLPGGRYQRLA